MKTFKKLNLIAEVGLPQHGNMTLAHSYRVCRKIWSYSNKVSTHYAAEESSRYDKFRVRNKFIKYSTGMIIGKTQNSLHSNGQS